MFGFIFSPLGKALGGALVVILAFSGVYHYGKSVGRQGAAMEALEATIKAYKDRNDENAAIEALDPYRLCLELGGLPDDCRAELRRLGEDHGQVGDSRLSGGQ